jgi:hypothetical protein
MAKPAIIVVEGRAYNWQRLCELRRQQVDAWRAAQAAQPALFELKEDHRPAAERTAAGRYVEPTLWEQAKPPSEFGAASSAKMPAVLKPCVHRGCDDSFLRTRRGSCEK